MPFNDDESNDDDNGSGDGRCDGEY